MRRSSKSLYSYHKVGWMSIISNLNFLSVFSSKNICLLHTKYEVYYYTRLHTKFRGHKFKRHDWHLKKAFSLTRQSYSYFFLRMTSDSFQFGNRPYEE